MACVNEGSLVLPAANTCIYEWNESCLPVRCSHRASSSASRFQHRGARASVARWSRSRVPCWWLSSSVRYWSSSPTVDQFRWHAEAAFPANMQETWRREFLGLWFPVVEWSSTGTTAAVTVLRFLRMISENLSFWQQKRLVTVLNLYVYINKLIHLSIYPLHFGWYSCFPSSWGWEADKAWVACCRLRQSVTHPIGNHVTM